jgi:peptide deformylase
MNKDPKHDMDVLAHPNPALSQPAREVAPASDDTLCDLVNEMAKAMYEAPGIGLAATQIGVLKRVIVYDLEEGGRNPVALCNPVIVERSDECEEDDEGCLSLPGITVPVTRSCKVTCEGLSIEGNVVRFDAEGLHARLIQHELDHLDGVLIIDRATPEERRAALRRYREAQELGAKPGQTSI